MKKKIKAPFLSPNIKDTSFDVIVVGGGPAGMMAAGRAAEGGARVLLLEKNEKLGKKLLITGGGRCNVMNGETDVHALTKKYGKKGAFLFSPLSQFGVRDTFSFLDVHGIQTIEEEGKRIFPKTERAETIWNMCLEYMKKGKVITCVRSRVTGFSHRNGRITGVQTASGNYTGDSYILATGGKSHPETGSTGEGFTWLSKIGHTIKDSAGALVPVAVSDSWIKKAQGTSFKEAKVALIANGEKVEEQTGKILFTHFGLSGPLILNMAASIGERLKYREKISLLIDLFPKMDLGTLDRHIEKIIRENQNKKWKNVFDSIVPPKLAQTLILSTKIDGEISVNAISRDARKAVGKLLKGLSANPTHLLGLDKAVISGGGVDLREVDFKTMQSKLFPNLFLVGDVLDFDRPTGGYSLQICWTTGYVAGTHAQLLSKSIVQ